MNLNNSQNIAKKLFCEFKQFQRQCSLDMDVAKKVNCHLIFVTSPNPFTLLQYVSEVVIGAPYAVTADLMDHFKVL